MGGSERSQPRGLDLVESEFRNDTTHTLTGLAKDPHTQNPARALHHTHTHHTLTYTCNAPPPPHQHRGPGLQVALGCPQSWMDRWGIRGARTCDRWPWAAPSPERIDGGAGAPVPVTGGLGPPPVLGG